MSVRGSTSFAELLRQHRRALGLTQEELAERAGISPRGVRALEAGERQAPQRETIRLLADALELQGTERREFESAARDHGPLASRAEGTQRQFGARGREALPGNLPDGPTRFIGREQEVAHVASLLRDPHTRLVTMTGPGGVGKTRLAMEVGAFLLHDFRDGVFFVNLAALSDPALVPSTIAEVLDIKEEAGRNLRETLSGTLRTRRLLLVLDNFEHLLDAARFVAELLDECRELHVLVTSRIALHLQREHRHTVPPLTVPDPEHPPGLGALTRYEAVALFVERARAASDSFGLTAENAPDVAAICARLDGLPLAIELAAARTRLFPPHALLERLSHRLSLLTTGARDLPERQRTLRGAIEWSFSLLEPAEQALFARLSVFAGGCTLEGAERVCNPDGDLPIDLVEGVASLVEKSLLQQEGEAEPRLTMLETIREYAAEALDERGEKDALRAAHAATFLQLAEAAEPELTGPGQASWLSRLDAELGNLRPAMQTFLDRGQVEAELRLAAALHRFWDIRGHWSEGRRWIEVGLARSSRIGARTRADALTTLGLLLMRQGEFEQAAAALGESLDLWQAAGDMRGKARALLTLGGATSDAGRHQQAAIYFQECLKLAREAGDAATSVSALGSLGRLSAQMGDLAASRDWFEQALSLSRQIGDLRPQAITLLNLGDVEARLGRLSAAEMRLEEARLLALDLGDTHNLAYVLQTLAEIRRKQGQIDQAKQSLRQSARLARELGASSLMLVNLGEAATLAATAGEPVRAAELLAAEEAIRERLSIPVPAEDRASRGGLREQVRSMLAEEDFSRAVERGTLMSLETAITFAVEESE